MKASLAMAVSALVLTSTWPLAGVDRQSQAQASASTAPADKARFEAASIRPCRPEEAPPGPARGTAGGTNASFSPGRMNVPCVTLEQLIYLAYAGPGATRDEWLVNDGLGGASDATKVRGGPAWVHSQHDKFAVEATAPGASERHALLGTMLQTLLEDRFQLKIHRDTEQVPMYALTVAKGGFKLKPAQPGDCEAFVPGEAFDPNAAKPRCGNMTTKANGPNVLWIFTGFDLGSLAGRLSRTLDRHVIDRTQISGDFIIRLEFHPDENTPGIVWPAEREADETIARAASVLTALEQQLGLKIEKTKAPRGFLVIDHVERLAGR